MDATLIALLRGAMSFRDRVAEAGLKDRIVVKLSRRDGLALLGVVTGLKSPFVEYQANGRFVSADGINSIDISGVMFQWPSLEALSSASNMLHNQPARLERAER